SGIARGPVADQRDGVDLKQQRRRAPGSGRLRIEHVRRAARHLEGLDPPWVLVQQEPQIGGWPDRRRDCQQHSSILPAPPPRLPGRPAPRPGRPDPPPSLPAPPPSLPAPPPSLPDPPVRRFAFPEKLNIVYMLLLRLNRTI